jgi:hypothetical protein
MLSRKLLILGLALVLSACSAMGPTVRTNSISPTQISQYKTFGYFEPLNTDQRYESLLSQYLKKQTTMEMRNRGFKYAETDPDLLINFSRTIEDKQQTRHHPSTRYGYFGRGYYDIWTQFEPYELDYQQDTITVDIVDRKQNKVVWQGMAIDQVQDASASKLQTLAPNVIIEIFKQFSGVSR